MHSKNFIKHKVFFLLLLTAFSSLQARYEVCFHITDRNGDPLGGVSFTVYYLDNNSKTYTSIGTGTSQAGYFWTLAGYGVNGAFDINDNYSLVHVPAEKAQTIAIKIGTQVIRMDYQGFPNPYGDALIIIPYSGSWIIDPYTGGYSFTGPQNWHDYQINLSNNMGGDAGPNVQGVIHFDSENIPVGTTPVSRYREGTTFLYGGHSVSGENNQLVGQYYRTWRHWNQSDDTNISKSLTSQIDYNLITYYGRQFNITYENYFNSCDNGGTIKVDNVSQNSPYSPSTGITEYYTYAVEAVNQTYKSIYYTFNHWELDGVNKSTSAQYSFPGIFGATLQARFTGKPTNSYRSLRISATVNQPDTLYWNAHPSECVTGYRIYRRVRPSGGSPGPEELIATINSRTTTTYIDYDYVVSQSFYYQIFYDVRAYYSPDGTMPDADFVSTFADEGLQAKMENSSDKKMVTKEVPSEYSLNNYPNPFNPTTTINYQLPSEGMVTLKVYDVIGKEIATLVNGHRVAGTYNVEFNASDLPSGIYIYRLSANNFTQSKKMLLMK